MLEDKLDNDMYEMVKEEISELTPRQKELEERLRILLLGIGLMLYITSDYLLNGLIRAIF